MSEDLDRRLASLRESDDVDGLTDLGCDLSEVGRHVDAEWCFRRAVDLGDDTMCFNLGNALYDQGRYEEAASAFQRAAAAGEDDAWLNLGQSLNELGDLSGALRAFEAGSTAGDADATAEWAFILRAQDKRSEAEQIMQRAAEQDSEFAAAALAAWRWERTDDPGLEPELRAGVEHYEFARSSLGELLRATGRVQEAIEVLREGLDAEQASSAIPLGNIYADDLVDAAAAAAAYRRGIELGDAYCHHNLAGLLEAEGKTEEAINHYRMAAAEGDELASEALRRLSEDGE